MAQLTVQNILKHNTDEHGAMQYIHTLKNATQSESMHNRPFYTTGINVRYLKILPGPSKNNSQLRKQNSYQISGH
jgi:hypothetical protein